MDRIDRILLAALERDARLTYAEIAAEVALAPSSVHDRVRKLERAGVIKAYRAELDRDQTGFAITALVSLTLQPSSASDIPSKVAELPFVESCYSVAGDYSYVLVVRTPTTRDLEQLLDTLRGKLEVLTRSTVVLSTPFERRPLLATSGESEPGSS
ncbi:MAG: Lrp/AsnC family transcriptional regulator [Actinomycetota bacterium]|nr:Lrp/AsnC family transcriptional regulator [Actinomycetota bacterium]